VGILDDAIREHLELKRRHGADDEELAKQEAEALGPARREPAVPAGPGDAVEDAPPPDPDAAASVTGDAAPPPPDPEAAAGLSDDVAPPPPPEAIEPLHAEPSELDPLEPPATVEEPEPFDDLGPPTEAMPAAELPDDPFGTPPARPMGADDDDPLATPVDPIEAIEPEAASDIAPLDDETRLRPLPPVDDDELPPRPAVPPADEAPEDEPTRIRPAPASEDESTAERPAADPSDDVLEETPDFLQDTPDHDRLWFEQRPPRDFDFDE
jgi:hypothetical protein